MTSSGRACLCAALYPEDGPRWCWNCDPSKREERRAKGAIRVKPPAEVQTKRALAAGQTATVDRIVELCLKAADRVDRGTLGPREGNALAKLYAKALDAIRARATTGDAAGASHRDPKPSNTPRPPVGDLSALEEILDA